MRKTYTLENKNELAWGMDFMSGFFVQIFDESNDEEEILLINADQGNALSGFSIANEDLTYDKMAKVLKENSKEAYSEFENLMDRKLPYSLLGYRHIDKKGFYERAKLLTTFRDLFLFLDQIQFGYTLTDDLDRATDLYDIFQELKAL